MANGEGYVYAYYTKSPRKLIYVGRGYNDASRPYARAKSIETHEYVHDWLVNNGHTSVIIRIVEHRMEQELTNKLAAAMIRAFRPLLNRRLYGIKKKKTAQERLRALEAMRLGQYAGGRASGSRSRIVESAKSKAIKKELASFVVFFSRIKSDPDRAHMIEPAEKELRKIKARLTKARLKANPDMVLQPNGRLMRPIAEALF